MQELRDAEDAAQKSEQQVADARSVLQRKSEELLDCKAQLSAVQIDLRVCSPEPTCENMSQSLRKHLQVTRFLIQISNASKYQTGALHTGCASAETASGNPEDELPGPGQNRQVAARCSSILIGLCCTGQRDHGIIRRMACV